MLLFTVVLSFYFMLDLLRERGREKQSNISLLGASVGLEFLAKFMWEPFLS